ncbi:lipocalin family protein [Arenimonas caeni]|uniref:lipocalin family protein n=1 Tax=Arenimonas caeni TaxID=2058085 RepID=UPI001F055CA3|nr:lipocalin family protein [Arenimonas caeni]
MRRLATIVLLALLAGCASTGGTNMPPLRTEASVDLERYMGRWWVIANVPYFAERGKVATADVYALREDGRISNTYVYRKAFDKPEKSMAGVATVLPGSNNAHWRIAFWRGLVKADLLVMEVAPDYSWALIGHPKRRLAWIFGREQTMDEALYLRLRARFADWGYDPETILRVPQRPEQAGQPGFQ